VVWSEVSSTLNFPFQWEGHTLEQAWKNWWENSTYKTYRLLPLLITWGVWIARNESIFKEATTTPRKTSLNSLSILSSFLSKERTKNRVIKEVYIEKSTPWGFFDGASQHYTCGGGAYYTTQTHTTSLYLLDWEMEQTIMLN
jgi:hypothetical protein